MNSFTESCSGRLLKISFSMISGLSSERSELRMVLRRWLKDCFTMVTKSFSSQPKSAVVLRLIFMTADFTFGGGLNTFSWTVFPGMALGEETEE